MRAGLTTVNQTLTPEAAAVLNQAVAEAARRNHGQATPLHVAATLLSSPAGFLRHACIKSQPNSSHPLQCRALDLCFSVALERLPVSQNAGEPPISNALVAALKRAQAQQRRGCPDHHQQPLLAVKVELEQLVISILDDPSVSRVMREASFSSPAVKATVEQSKLSTSTTSHGNSAGNTNFHVPRLINPPSSDGSNFDFRPVGSIPVSVPVTIPGGRDIYVNPKLQKSNAAGGGVQLGQQRDDVVEKVIDIMSRTKKRNPVLVGESQPEIVMKEVLKKADDLWNSVKIFHLEKEVRGRIVELIESWMADFSPGGGIIIDVGDLRWLVEQPLVFVGTSVTSGNGGMVTEAGRAVVADVRKVLWNHGKESKVWLIGTATCETYLRCQVYYSTLEADWDLQAVPVAARTLTRYANPAATGNPPLKAAPSLPPPAAKIVAEITKCCPQCKLNYEQEVVDFTSTKMPDCADDSQMNLPRWMRKATSHETVGSSYYFLSFLRYLMAFFVSQIQKRRILELQKKWQDKCVELHSPTTEVSPPESPVRTDLALGRLPKEKQEKKLSNSYDVDFVKKVLKGLLEAVSWQQDAATAVASVITRCKLGNGKRRGGDIWLLFTGPDKVAKRKMVTAVSDLVCDGDPTVVSLGSKRFDEMICRRKTALDRIVEAVRRNPFSVVMLDDIDEADMILRGSIKRAIERGRLVDSHGREFSLGNVVFILTATWLPDDFPLPAEVSLDQKKIAVLGKGDWQLRLSLCEKTAKRQARWLLADRPIKHKKDLGLLDLNEAADVDNASEQSSTTFECEEEQALVSSKLLSPALSSFSRELVSLVDDNVVFKPVDWFSLRRNISSAITKKVTVMIGEAISVAIQDEALERIVCGVWLGWMELEEWSERALVPIVRRLKLRLPAETEAAVVRLEVEDDSSGWYSDMRRSI